MRTILVWTFGISVLVATPVAPVLAQGEGNATLNCNANGVDLQDRLTHASAGSTVWITGHCDKGPYFVHSDVTIRGFGTDPTTLSAPAGSKWVVVVQMAVLKAADLQIAAPNGATGILLHGAKLDANQIVVENGAVGVRVGVHSQASVTNSTIRNHLLGIEVAESSNAFLNGNVIEGNRDSGIKIQMGSSATVQANSIRQNAVGAVVESNGSIHLLANTIAGNEVGLLVRRNGFVHAVIPPSTFSGNGIDVRCFESGMIDAESGPLGTLPSGIEADATCRIFGSVF